MHRGWFGKNNCFWKRFFAMSDKTTKMSLATGKGQVRTRTSRKPPRGDGVPFAAG